MTRYLLLFLFLIGCYGAEWDIYWRDFKGNIPSDAVPGGDGVFIGQVIYEGFLMPGSIFPKSKKFVSEYYGKFEVEKDIKVLCSGSPKNIKWERIHTDNIPQDLTNRLIEGGFQNEMPWYVGRTFHQNEWRVGKVGLGSPYFKGLLIWNDNNSSNIVNNFEVLTYV